MGIIEKMKLDGKKGFVTGAARGIGKSTATAFAEAGADVAIVDLDIAEAEKTAAELAEKTGRKVIAIRTDCTDPEQVDAMVEQVARELGGLDFCHNNAGICINAPAEEMTYAQWSKVININLNGIFLTDIAAGKYMLAHGGGSIINTASMSAHIVNVPQPQCAYNASKAAVIQLTKSLAISRTSTQGCCLNGCPVRADICASIRRSNGLLYAAHIPQDPRSPKITGAASSSGTASFSIASVMPVISVIFSAKGSRGLM